MLTSKQRAYLKSIAANEDTILIVGKGGITSDIIKQANDALNARELIKGKTLETAPLTAKETSEEIASKTSSEVVLVVGRKFVLYRKNEDEPKIILPKKTGIR
jgi:RNA-binding protein